MLPEISLTAADKLDFKKLEQMEYARVERW